MAAPRARHGYRLMVDPGPPGGVKATPNMFVRGRLGRRGHTTTIANSRSVGKRATISFASGSRSREDTELKVTRQVRLPLGTPIEDHPMGNMQPVLATELTDALNRL